MRGEGFDFGGMEVRWDGMGGLLFVSEYVTFLVRMFMSISVCISSTGRRSFF